MNQDMIINILSHSPLPVVKKFRVLNKECNKRTYKFSFLQLSLQRTNCISGYFLEYKERLAIRSTFVQTLGNRPGGSEVSLDFLPPGRASISACDASQGILLCVNDLPSRGREPEFIVCKPTTKQYLILPSPRTRYVTVSFGLMVIRSNPLRYKILRLSYLPYSEYYKRYNKNSTYYVCEVFDSVSFAWKRVKNLELHEFFEEDTLSRNSTPTAYYGFLHWVTTNNNVIRFCFETETWSYFPVSENLRSATSLILTRYEGKLGMICSRSKEGVAYEEIWVLENIFGDAWVHVQEIENIGLKRVGFLANDVITLADVDRICLYNMNSGNSQNLQVRTPRFSPSPNSVISYFPLYSDFERVEF